MKRIDLHVHSTASDGTFTPTELVQYAKKINLSAFALTDHDTIKGLSEAEEAAKEKGIELIPGIELSSEYHKKEIHILGLYIDDKNPELAAALQKFADIREKRNEKMAKKLSDYGLPITIDELRKAYSGAILTRAHFAKYLKEKGYLSSIEEGFHNYIGKNGPCYIPRTLISSKDAITLIQKAKGIAVLAHPLLYSLTMEELKDMTEELKRMGLEGIEVFYSMNEDGDEERVGSLAKELGLLMTGGSDFHGSTKPYIDMGNGRGDLFVSESLLEPLKSLRKRKKK